MNAPHDSPLGKTVAYPREYDPHLLHPIARAAKRAEIGVSAPLPFAGVDIWNAYEFSWLDARGKPVVALAEFRVPAESPHIVESKSFKLYLNSFSQTRVPDEAWLRTRLGEDLARAAGAAVKVGLIFPSAFTGVAVDELVGEALDALDIAIDDYGPPRAEYLHADAAASRVEEILVSHLLKSNCPVTGQPDWASVQIAYAGAPIEREGLLRYLVSYREHAEFHEQCVERIFMDLTRRCAPERLSVYARYTRRGGLDINPFRASAGLGVPANARTARQ